MSNETHAACCVPTAIAPRQDGRALASRVASRFHSPFQQHYAKWKLRTDPLYEATAGLLMGTRLPVLDIGCGCGLLAFHIRERGIAAPITGIDFDADKVQAARSVAPHYSPQPEFHTADARHPWPPVSGHVCLLDFLQYLPAVDQQLLLAKAASHVSPDGLLIIRSGLFERGWRHQLTTATDRVVAWLRLMKSRPISYPSRTSLQDTLAATGLHLREDRALHHGTPFSNHLLVFARS